MRGEGKSKIPAANHHFSADLLDWKWTEKVKGYLGLRFVVIEVVERGVVGVVGFVQQLNGERPAERLRHKRVLEGKPQAEQRQQIFLMTVQ